MLQIAATDSHCTPPELARRLVLSPDPLLLLLLPHHCLLLNQRLVVLLPALLPVPSSSR
jgi:hypothetical protein